MPVDAVTAARIEVREPPRTGNLGQLTKVASWNAGASIASYGVRIATRLVITPILVTGLGRSLFGVWEIIGRIGSYLAAEGQPTHALRLIVAQGQADRDPSAKRRYVGAALVVWVLVLPLLAGAAALFAWIAPGLTQSPPPLHGAVRLTCALLVLTLAIGALASVTQSVLQGMNLGYKRLGWQAGLSILGGVLAAGSVSLGFGLPGLGWASVITAAAAGLCFYMLVRRYVPWFGAERPTSGDVRSLFGMSAWLSAGDVIAKVTLATDVVILGAIVAPAVVTTYALTGYAARTATGLHVFATSAAIPGLGGVLGSRQFDRATQVRAELLLLTWLFATVVGVNVLLWNRAFLGLWVGPENYAGITVDLLIVALAVQTAFIRVDAYVIDAMLRPRVRVLVGALAAVVTLASAIALTQAFGMVGLCAGILIGRGVQSVAYPLLVRAQLRGSASVFRTSVTRLILTTALLMALGAIFGQRTMPDGWPSWIAGVAVSVVATTAAAFALGPSREARHALRRRIRAAVIHGAGS